ncbi:SusC/RagA family TonB-linked outer membrane protein [Chitinophaga sp. NPDC101104]|uniref:SusC/RagA family TonB-linked outer membrane protein n=1 Tax=Chitinophaga sp. NPDC101104 TaxID=3390561 RepID=UPI003CFFB565
MQKIRQHFFVRTVMSCLFVLAATVTSLALPLSAQDLQKVVRKIDIPAGPLSTALKQLETSAAVRLAYDEAALKRVSVKAHSYNGRTVEAILSELLSASGLKFEERHNTILIYEAPKQPAVAIPGGALADKITITGVVNEKNGPVPGASVMVKGTSTGTVTTVDGRFKLTADDAAGLTLVVSMLGYGTQEIVVGSRRDITVLLESSTVNLNQLVVIGYGTQSKAKVTGAVAEVPLDKLTSRSLGSLNEALQGKAPGVVVQNEGGDPMSGPRVSVRGMGGINGENVLVVVDGAIYYGPINPNDVESVTFLKDASSSIYGARAAGGVMLVTTKKGKQGKAQVDVDVKQGWQSPIKKLEPLNAKEFADVMNQAYDAAGKPRQDAFDPAKYPDGQITRTDWMDEIFRTAKIQDYNASVKGGTDMGRYYLSFGYRKGEGILLNTYNERYTVRMNTDYQLKPWLKIGENMTMSVTDGNGANTTSAYTGAIISAIFYPPHIRPYTADGGFSGLPAQYAGAYGDVINPVAYLQRIDSKSPETKIFFNPYADINLTKGLVFRSSFSITKSFRDAKTFNAKVLEIGKIFNYNELNEDMNNFTEMLAEQTLTYTTKFNGGHNLTAMGGFSFQKHRGTWLGVNAQGFYNEMPSYRYFDNSTVFFRPRSGLDKNAMSSWYGRVNYDYRNKYLLQLIGRYDGTSMLPKHNRWEPYYGITGGWVLTEEEFLKNSSWLNFLKLRLSHGIQGNLGSLVATGVDAPMSSGQIWIGKDPQQVPTYQETALPNKDLKWASTEINNIGLDFNLFDNRLSVNADYFEKTTHNMLVHVSVPGMLGVPDGMWKNAGKALDKGLELGLNWQGKQTGDFRYDVGATFTKITNKLVSLADGQKVINRNDINIRSTITPIRQEVGLPLYSFYVVRTDGMFQSQAEVDAYKDKDGNKIQPFAKPGDLKFIDQNGDGKITNDDRVVAGSAFPKFTYGFTFNASYKNFDFNMLLQGVQGNKLFNALKFTALNAGNGQNYNMLKDILNAWTPQNTGSNIPRINSSDPNGNFGTTSDWYVEDGSYMRVKNLTLGYTVPETLLRRAGLGKVRLYVTGNNLLTFTKYKGFDPEVGLDEFGIDKGRYPQAKNVTVGLNVNF